MQSATAAIFDPFSSNMPIHSTLTPPMRPSQLYHSSSSNNSNNIMTPVNYSPSRPITTTTDWLPTVLSKHLPNTTSGSSSTTTTTNTNTTPLPTSSNTNILPISVMNPVIGQMSSYNSNTVS